MRTTDVLPGVEVYEGMVLGENGRPGDLAVNVCKKRHVSNVRRSFKEIDDALTPPREMSLDQCIEDLNDCELLEVTPRSLRLRKRILASHARGRAETRAKEAMGGQGRRACLTPIFYARAAGELPARSTG